MTKLKTFKTFEEVYQPNIDNTTTPPSFKDDDIELENFEKDLIEKLLEFLNEYKANNKDLQQIDNKDILEWAAGTLKFGIHHTGNLKDYY